MNTSSRPITDYTSKFDRLARQNPTRSLLVAIGVGLAAGLLVRTLRPHTPESRAARLLTDIRDRLHSIAAPVQRQAEHLIESGSSAVSDGVAHLQDLHLGRGVQRLGERFKSLCR
jgi:ElaB/YqjD/DUF883 family membrane-anchored ribosome-binding protein